MSHSTEKNRGQNTTEPPDWDETLVSPSLVAEIKAMEDYLHGKRDFPCEGPHDTVADKIDETRQSISDIPSACGDPPKNALPPPLPLTSQPDNTNAVEIPPPPRLPDLHKKLQSERRRWR